MTFDNTKNYALKKETDKLYRLTDRCFIMREAKVQKKDYFVKKTELRRSHTQRHFKFRHDLIDHKVIIETHAIDRSSTQMRNG